jgi:hypothetical protein
MPTAIPDTTVRPASLNAWAKLCDCARLARWRSAADDG